MRNVSRLLSVIVILVIVAVNVARFVYLEADFPQGMTWEGALYTDEGWYANGAISHFITGKWYLEGDFNKVIDSPVFNVMQALTFKILGLSLFSARVTEILFYLLTIALATLLVRRYINASAALVTALLLSMNYTLFAYSRLALTELPMASVVLFSLFIALYFPPRNYVLVGGIAAVTFCLAILTKTNALMLFPVLLYALAARQSPIKPQVYACVWGCVVLIVSFALYYVVGKNLYADYSSYNLSPSVFSSRFTLNPLFVIHNIFRAIWDGTFLEPLMYPLTISMMLLPVFFVVSKAHRDNPLIVVCYLWIFLSLAVLSLSRYHPPRYYLHLGIPITILFSIIGVMLFDALKPSYWSYLPIIIVTLIVITNASSIIRYLQQPQYSFLAMTQDIRQRIRQEYPQDALLLGNMANSISLATGIPSMNTQTVTRDLRWKIAHYRPNYYVSLGAESDVLNILSEFYHLEPVAAYDVFGNYYGGKRVDFYRLKQK